MRTESYFNLRLMLILTMGVVGSGVVVAAPSVSKQAGLYILENEFLRAEVKYTELYRVTWKATGQELMSPGWHGVINLCAKSKVPGRDEPTWLFQDTFARNRKYDIETDDDQATLIVNFDWVARPDDQPPYYAVEQRITTFAEKPYLRVSYRIVAKQPPDPAPGSFMVQSSGTQGTHFIEPNGQLRIEELGDARLAGMRTDPGSYWFAIWDKPSGHYTAFLRPGQTDPTRCVFHKGTWYVSRWSEPFLSKPGQSYAEELWIIGGKMEGAEAAPIVQTAQDGYAFAGKHEPVLATLQSPYVTHAELSEQVKHLRADGKGDHIVFRNERLYVDGEPFILFAPWGIDPQMWKTYKQYHLTGVFGSIGNADAAEEHGLKIVPSALEWPNKRGKELEEHIRAYTDHPAIIAWFLQDDFGGDLSMLGNIEIIRSIDTHRPTVADVVGYDASRRRASAFVDICSPYTYPAPVHTYRWYEEYLEHDQQIMERQFNWTCPQAMSYSAFARTGQTPGYFGEYPTAAQMRLQTYLGLAHGIRGFMYWPVRGMYDYKLAELGIVCLEVEPVTALIVEAERNPQGASCDNEQIDVQRIDHEDFSLLFFINHREKSERWPTGELAPKFTVTFKGGSERMQAYSMTLDKDLQVGQPQKVGEQLQFEVSGLDVAAMVAVTAEGRQVFHIQQALEQRREEATEFATTTNKYMAGKVHELLTRLSDMQAPLGKAPDLYASAIGKIETEKTFTGQRRIARTLRQAIGEVLAQADNLADYSPSYAKNSLLINVWTLPQFMGSFNFRAFESAPTVQIPSPPAIASMEKRPEPEKAVPIETGAIVTGGEGRGSDGYVAGLEADTTYCGMLHTTGSALNLYADEAAYLAGRSDFVPVPNANLGLSVTICRPEEAMDLYAAIPKAKKSFGVLAAGAMALGDEVTGPRLTAENPVAVYELAGGKGDSFEVTIKPAAGCRFDLILCQAYPRYGQVLASDRTDGKKPLALKCTLNDDRPLAVVIERYSGDGEFSISVQRIAEKVIPQKTVNPFAGVKFALFGKDTCNFLSILAAQGIAGDHLVGKLAEADLSSYDVMVVLTNAIQYDEDDELQANAEKLKTFVYDGGSIVVFQQNGRETWDDSIFPYPLKLVIGNTTTVPALADERLFAAVKPEEFVGGDRRVVYYPIDVGATDKQWRYLAYADDEQKQGAVAVCEYGKGHVIINQFAVLDRIGEPVMRSLMVDTVEYVPAK